MRAVNAMAGGGTLAMVERGGPTTQAGIPYKNSGRRPVSAICCVGMSSTRPSGWSRRGSKCRPMSMTLSCVTLTVTATGSRSNSTSSRAATPGRNWEPALIYQRFVRRYYVEGSEFWNCSSDHLFDKLDQSITIVRRPASKVRFHPLATDFGYPGHDFLTLGA